MKRSLGNMSHKGLALPIQQLFCRAVAGCLSFGEDDASSVFDGAGRILFQRPNNNKSKCPKQFPRHVAANGLKLWRIGLIEQGNAPCVWWDIFQSALWVGEDGNDGLLGNRFADQQAAKLGKYFGAVDSFFSVRGLSIVDKPATTITTSENSEIGGSCSAGALMGFCREPSASMRSGIDRFLHFSRSQ